MYGAPRKGQPFNVRSRKVYTENNISMAFYRAQLETAKLGYKLLDCSDPSKMKNMDNPSVLIVLATKDQIMDEESAKIWHSFNKLSRKAKEALQNVVKNFAEDEVDEADEADEDDEDSDEDEADNKDKDSDEDSDEDSDSE